MKTLVQILISATLLIIISAIVMFMYSDEIGGIGDSSGDLVNNTGCKYAQQQLDEGEIDELPQRCQTGLEPKPPQISAA